MAGLWAEHLGRNKPEVAPSIQDALARADDWRACVRSLREELARAAQGLQNGPGTKCTFGTNCPDARIGGRSPLGVAFVPPSLAARAEALVFFAPPTSQAALRICRSPAPDAIRASLAALGDLSSATAWFPGGDEPREQLVHSLGFGRSEPIPSDTSSSILSPAALALAACLGADIRQLLRDFDAQLDQLAKAPLETCEPFRLGALLRGLASRGIPNLLVAAPPQLMPLARWIESTAANLPDTAGIQVSSAESLQPPEAYGPDRWIAAIHFQDYPDPQTRRLIGAGVPLVQMPISSAGNSITDLLPWHLALHFANTAHSHSHPHPHPHSTSSSSSSSTPALTEGPLELHTSTEAHAYILGKVAGTLGKLATTSAHHWLAAQLAMAEPPDFISLHWLPLAGPHIRAALARLQTRLSGPHRLAVRVSTSLPELPPCAGSSSRGLYFLMSNGGGPDLAVTNETHAPSLRHAAGQAELRTLHLLGAHNRRAILLRAEDGDATKLIAALERAGELLAR